MTLAPRITLRWLPLAGLATAVCLLVYVCVQQMWRQSANDPQIQMARDTARQLAAGAPAASLVAASPVDFASSLAPFVMILNEAGEVIASSGRLHGEVRAVPAGVLDHVRRHGEERVTWQPEPGVRIAAIVRQPTSGGGFVLAGRSLRETEDRIGLFGRFVGLAWFAMLGGLFVLVAASEYMLAPKSLKQAPSA